MKCHHCGNTMHAGTVYTKDNNPSMHYTLHGCECGTICKEGFDLHLGTTWVLANGSIVTDKACNINISDPDANRLTSDMQGWQFTLHESLDLPVK